MPETTEQVGFDYATVDAKARAVAQKAALEIRRRLKRSAEDIVAVGQCLIAAKQSLGHGQFSAWVASEFGWGERQPRRFMECAEAFKTANLADLPIAASALYELASPSTPPEVRTEMLATAEAGETVTHAMVKEAIAATRDGDEPEEPKSLFAAIGSFRRKIEQFIEKRTSRERQVLGEHLIEIGNELVRGQE